MMRILGRRSRAIAREDGICVALGAAHLELIAGTDCLRSNAA
jgi:hypothetical protein